MLSMSFLASSLKAAYPDYTFVVANEFRWSPREQTVFYDPKSQDTSSLLHELSHALLEHSSYHRDVELLELEQAAWQYALDNLAQTYGVIITPEQIEECLDTYRDWLHARSTCPQCQATGIQTKSDQYECVACFEKWRVNDARICALRRYKLSPTKKTP